MSKKQYSLKEALMLNLRAILILHEHSPQLFPATALYAVSSAVAPYASIYCSAQIISELAGQRDPQKLWFWVVTTIVVTAVFALLNGVLLHWRDSRKQLCLAQKHRMYSGKMLDMDFSAMDQQRTHDLRRTIYQNENISGWGFNRIALRYCDSLIHSLVSLLSAVTLSHSLFAQSVPETAGSWTLLNHPLCALLAVALLLLFSVISPACTTKSNNLFVSFIDRGKFGNAVFAYCTEFAMDKKRRLDIRIYGQDRIQKDRFGGGDNIFMPGSELTKCAAGPMGLLEVLGAVFSVLSIGVVYLFVCLKAWIGAFGVGQVTQYVGAITIFTQGIAKFVNLFGELKNNAAFLETTFEYLDIRNQMYQGSLTTEKRSDRQYEVEFRDVSFQYPGSEQYSLRHVNMKFKIGQKLAIVGMNGSGKTTFIKLLCRLYDPTEGQILLNGIDIRKYRYDDYMDIFSIVFQDFQLLSFPLAENVAVGREYDRERVIDCLEKAGFADRLATMPKGIDTYLYKDFRLEGVEVSGGEAQKIAIARSLYKDAPFIILDEPTAALDPVAEAEIYSKFNDIVGDKTAIYISHRLSSCRFCDDILVFDQGTIVQQGDHDTLVEQEGGKYHELWYAQAQYYEKKNAEQ